MPQLSGTDRCSLEDDMETKRMKGDPGVRASRGKLAVA